MNIAFFHELPEGGAKSSTLKMANLLCSFGYNVDLYYVAEKKDILNNYKFRNEFFYEFKQKKWVGNDWKKRLYKDTIELYKIYKLDRKIAADINSKKYDLVLINASQFIESPFILRFLNSYKVFYAHDPNYRMIYEKSLDISKKLSLLRYNYEKVNRTIRKRLDYLNIHRANLILANSNFASRVIFKTYNRRSTVVYLGVDENLFKPKKVSKEIDILFVGTFDEIDGYDLLSDALKNIKNKLNVVAVPGKSRWISNQQHIVDLYQKSKIVVCLAINEPFGLVPLESMSCGVPVIAVNEGGYTETVVNNKTGFLVKRQKEKLAGKIKLLLDNPKLAKEMGNRGRKEILSNWTWEKRGKELEKVLLEDNENISNNY